MRYVYCVLLLFLTASICVRAQSASDGNEFYLGLIYPSFNTVSTMSGNYTVTALVSSLEENTVSVSYFDPILGIEEPHITYKVSALNSITIPLNIQKMKMSASETKEYRSVHIKGKKKISVQYFSTGPSSGGAYLGLPINVLGKKYVVASYNDNPDGIGALVGGEAPSTYDIACGEFVVIGTQNGTSVSITMRTESTGGIKAGETQSISLNRGECYRVRSKCTSNDADISGSIVESTHPVALISGHSNASLGNVGNKVVELRDLMIEQMVPVEHWDIDGYTGLPFASTSPYTPDGAGDNYRVYSYDTATNQVMMNGSVDLSASRLNPREKFDVEQSAVFLSTNKKLFMPVEYDQASHGERDPFPRPSMMQLIPHSRYRSDYQFVVLQKTFEQSQSDYICFIPPASDQTKVSKNGGVSVPLLQAGFTPVISSAFEGKTYKVSPGSYRIFIPYAHGKGSFMIYQFGFRGMSADGMLGDADGDDSYTSYAMPAGVLLPYVDTASMTIEIDTLCEGWNVCVTDNRIEGRIGGAVLAGDPYGDIWPYDPRVRGPYMYNNTSFTPDLDPNNSREVIFSGLNATECFEVSVDNISKDGYAPIYITDKNGRGMMLELYYKKASASYQPSLDTVTDFGLEYVHTFNDTTFTFTNLLSSGKTYIVSEVDFIEHSPAYQILSVSPGLPAILKQGDSLKIKIRFTSADTGRFIDSLSIVTNCFTAYWQLDGRIGTPLITASDHNFGSLPPGKKSCVDTITVRNHGTLPFTLKKSYFLSDTTNFSFDPTSVRVGSRTSPLPIALNPGDVAKLSVCYHPIDEGDDNAELILQTDIPSPFSASTKNIIKLKGNAASTKVQAELSLEELTIYPNPTLGEDITASFGLTEAKELRFAIYDLLGREVFSVASSYFAKGKQSVILPVSKLAEGGYILRVSDGALTRSISFRVVR